MSSWTKKQAVPNLHTIFMRTEIEYGISLCDLFYFGGREEGLEVKGCQV